MSFRLGVTRTPDGAHDLFVTQPTGFADRLCRSDIARIWVTSSGMMNRRDGLKARALLSLGIDRGEVGQGYERGDRLAGALDDEPLPGGGLVDELAELLPDLERGHGSHSTIIAL
jgi:hypothetical protein